MHNTCWITLSHSMAELMCG